MRAPYSPRMARIITTDETGSSTVSRRATRSCNSANVGRDAISQTSVSRYYERETPLFHARAISIRCKASGTLRILIVFDLLGDDGVVMASSVCEDPEWLS
jgi:hypothetical protein